MGITKIISIVRGGKTLQPLLPEQSPHQTKYYGKTRQRFEKAHEKGIHLKPGLKSPNTKKEVRWSQYLVTLSATLLVFTGGTLIGWSSPALSLLQEPGSGRLVTNEEGSWIGSLLAIGAFIGALPTGSIGDLIGPKICMLILPAPVILSWILIIYTRALPVLYAARIIAGIALGGICTIVPLYISEIAESSIRGTLCSAFQLMLVTGILYTYSIGAVCAYEVLAVGCLIFPILFLMTFFFAPESPIYLLKKNKRKEAEESLRILKGSEQFISKELDILIADMRSSASSKSFFEGLSQKGSSRAVAISLGLMAFQQLAGINIIIFYAGSIFKDVGSRLEPNVAAIIVGFAQVVATVLSALLIDRAGRKILLAISSSIMAVCLAMLAFYFRIKDTEMEVSNLSMLPLVSVVVYILVYGIGMGPIPWMISGEILPPDIKGPITGIAVSLNWVLAFTVTKCFQDTVSLIGYAATYGCLTGICILSTIFSLFVVVETKGKSLQEIQDLLAGNKRGRTESLRMSGKELLNK